MIGPKAIGFSKKASPQKDFTSKRLRPREAADAFA
jgi:hypothetical protein